MGIISTIPMTKANGKKCTIYHKDFVLGDSTFKTVFLGLKTTTEKPNSYNICAVKRYDPDEYGNSLDINLNTITQLRKIISFRDEEMGIYGKDLFSVPKACCDKQDHFYELALPKENNNLGEIFGFVPDIFKLSFVHTILKGLYVESQVGINLSDDNLRNFGISHKGTIIRYDTEDFMNETMLFLQNRITTWLKLMETFHPITKDLVPIGEYIPLPLQDEPKEINLKRQKDAQKRLKAILSNAELWEGEATSDDIKAYFDIPDHMSHKVTLEPSETVGKTELQRAELAWGKLKQTAWIQ